MLNFTFILNSDFAIGQMIENIPNIDFFYFWYPFFWGYPFLILW